VFDLLTKDVAAERTAKIEKQLAEVIETLGAKPWTDGAGGTGYIPGPGVGDLYMTELELERKLKNDFAAHAESAPARYEAEIASIEARLAKGGGDADALKKRADTLKRLLKGSLGEVKLKERKSFNPGNGAFRPESEKPLEYMGSEYLDAMGLRRALRKADEEHNAKTGERLEAEMAALDAKIAKGEGDVDAFKKRREMCGRLLTGFKGAVKLKERPAMKPPSTDVHLASEKPLEHMHSAYFSAHDLERELAKADAEHWKLFAAKLEAEVPGLEAKVAKGEGDVDAAKKRLEVVKKLLKGEKGAEKLKERPALKGGVKVSNARMSSTVMMHKINVHRMLKSMRAT